VSSTPADQSAEKSQGAGFVIGLQSAILFSDAGHLGVMLVGMSIDRFDGLSLVATPSQPAQP
jgi:hypothetical protein